LPDQISVGAKMKTEACQMNFFQRKVYMQLQNTTNKKTNNHHQDKNHTHEAWLMLRRPIILRTLQNQTTGL